MYNVEKKKPQGLKEKYIKYIKNKYIKIYKNKKNTRENASQIIKGKKA